MISMRTRFCCPIDRYWPRQRISRLACFNSLWFCNKAHLHCLWQHLHCCCANLVFVAGGGDWKRGEAKINGKLIQIWKDYMPLGILFWFWIDLMDDPLPTWKKYIFHKRANTWCVQLFYCRFDTDCLQRREDSPSWNGRRISRDKMPVQEYEIWKLYFWFCSNIVHVCKLQEKEYKSREPFNLFFGCGVFTL